MEKGMKWWKEGKLLNKKNTFEDYIHVAKFLIDQRYSSKGKIIGMGGSAGGLLMGVVVNQAPAIFRNYNGSTICRLLNNKFRPFFTFDYWRI